MSVSQELITTHFFTERDKMVLKPVIVARNPNFDVNYKM